MLGQVDLPRWVDLPRRLGLIFGWQVQSPDDDARVLLRERQRQSSDGSPAEPHRLTGPGRASPGGDDEQPRIVGQVPGQRLAQSQQARETGLVILSDLCHQVRWSAVAGLSGRPEMDDAVREPVALPEPIEQPLIVGH